MSKLRPIAIGSDLMAFVREGDVGAYTYRSIAGQNGLSLNREDTDIETNAKNLGGVADYFNGIQKYSLSVEIDVTDPLDVDADEIDFEEILDADLAGTKFDIVVTYVTHSDTEGEAPVPDTSRPSWLGRYKLNAPMNGNPGEAVKSSISFKGCQIKLQKIAAV